MTSRPGEVAEDSLRFQVSIDILSICICRPLTASSREELLYRLRPDMSRQVTKSIHIDDVGKILTLLSCNGSFCIGLFRLRHLSSVVGQRQTKYAFFTVDRCPTYRAVCAREDRMKSISTGAQTKCAERAELAHNLRVAESSRSPVGLRVDDHNISLSSFWPTSPSFREVSSESNSQCVVIPKLVPSRR